MSRQLKNLVIGFLAQLPKSKYEQFNEAFELYRKSPNKNLGVERRLNSSGYSEQGLKNLLYDLQQLHGIKDAEVKSYVLEVISDEDFSKEGNEDKNLEDKNLEDSNLNLNEHSEKTDLPTDEKVKIREEFPFLNDKETPDEMHIVVGRKIAAHNRYAALHANITQVAAQDENDPELQELAKLAEQAFAENRALYDELNHYKENGTVLGKHPLFFELVAKKEVDTMTNEDMVKFKTSTATYLSRKKADLEKHKSNIEKLATISEAIAQRELKLKLVDARLGIKNE